MQPTYFASFLLGNQEGEARPDLAQVSGAIESWIFDNPHRSLVRPADFSMREDKLHELSGGETVQTRCIETDESNKSSGLFAVRFGHQDREQRLWRTDIVIDGSKDATDGVRCSVGVAVGHTQQLLAPVGSIISRPRLVPELITRFGAFEVFPLRAQHLTVGPGEVGLFVQLLKSTERRLPVVMVTCRTADNCPIADPGGIADQLAGIAYVCFAKNEDVTSELGNLIGPDLNVYDGSVRVYWPAFSASDSLFKHRLWKRSKVEALEEIKGGMAGKLLGFLAKLSAMRAVPGVTRWEDIQRRILLNAAGQAKSETEVRDLLDYALAENDHYSSQIDILRTELETAQRNLEAEKLASEQWRQSYVDARKNIPAEPDQAVEALLLKSVSEAVELAISEFSSEIEIPRGALRKEAGYYQNPELIFAAFRWLATTYRDARLGVRQVQDLDHSCREEVGLWYKPSQSDLTMKRFADDYKLVRAGQTRWLKEHIGKGSGTDPRRSIRVAFYFDEVENKVVIGFIGQHQQTAASN
jgi:hypothetical protein